MERWARIEIEDRECVNGNRIQDKQHMLLACLNTESEEKYGV